MKAVYKVSQFMVLLVWGVALILIVCGTLVLASVNPTADGWSFAILLCLIASAGYAMLAVYRTRAIIDPHGITYEGLFVRNRLLNEEIAGFRLYRRFRIVEPIDPSRRSITISHHMDRDEGLLDWLRTHHRNLDVRTRRTEMRRILADDSLGETKQSRKARLVQARRVAQLLNGIAMGVSVWVLVFPYPYSQLMLVLMGLPVSAIAIAIGTRGLIRIDDGRASAHPDLMMAVMVPSVTLLIRMIFGPSFLSLESLWIPAGSIAAVLFLAVLVGQRRFILKGVLDYLNIMGWILISLAYAIGVVLHTNVEYDTSEPTRYTAQVQERSTHRYRLRTMYHLELALWGPQHEPISVRVEERLYQILTPGSQVDIHYRKGAHGIPWIILSVPKQPLEERPVRP